MYICSRYLTILRWFSVVCPLIYLDMTYGLLFTTVFYQSAREKIHNCGKKNFGCFIYFGQTLYSGGFFLAWVNQGCDIIIFSIFCELRQFNGWKWTKKTWKRFFKSVSTIKFFTGVSETKMLISILHLTSKVLLGFWSVARSNRKQFSTYLRTSDTHQSSYSWYNDVIPWSLGIWTAWSITSYWTINKGGVKFAQVTVSKS